MSATAYAREHQLEGDIGRALAEMEFGTPPAVTRALGEALDRRALGYLGADETHRLQDAVGGWLHDSFAWEPPRDAIRPVADLVAGFRAILTHFVPEGEPIILPTPGYMPFLSVPPMIGRPVIQVPMIRAADGWRYDFDGLRAAFAAGARLLVLCNPHNPIGKVAAESELAGIEELVAEFDGVVFADEIHAPLVLGSSPHIVYAARSARAAAHTITATSATKAFNFPGTKCGQLIFTNPAHLARWREVGHWHEHQTSVLGVVATEAAYREGRAWLEGTLEALRAAVDEAGALLEEAAGRTGLRLLRPEATYLLWIDLRDTGLLREGVPAARAVREASKLVVTDGADCGEAGQGFVRFNAALPRQQVREAMQRLIRAAEGAR